jgi:hypothetical protein
MFQERLEHNMLENNYIIHDQRQVDLEDYIAGMLQAAEIAEQYLYGQAAALIRGSAAVLRHSMATSRQAAQASEKPVEGDLWYLPYKGVIYDMMDGRLAHRVYGALTNFASETEFLQATTQDLEKIPLLGQKTIETLVKLQGNWR